MSKISTTYFLVTPDNQKTSIDGLLDEVLIVHKMSKDIEYLLLNEEPSDEVISNILSVVASSDKA